MKFSEKLGYVLQGKTDEEIALIEAEQNKQLEEDKLKNDENSRLRISLEEAANMVKELEDKLQVKEEALKAKEDELTKLNADFANLNNKQTLAEVPAVKKPTDAAAQVFGELFNSKKEE